MIIRNITPYKYVINCKPYSKVSKLHSHLDTIKIVQ